MPRKPAQNIARTVIQAYLAQQMLPADLLIETVLRPIRDQLSDRAYTTFLCEGRGVVVIDVRPLLADQDLTIIYAKAADLGGLSALGDLHREMVRLVQAYDPETHFLALVLMPTYPPEVICWERVVLPDDEDDHQADDRATDTPHTVHLQPLSMLPAVAVLIDAMVTTTKEQHRSLTQARTRPGSMDAATLERTEHVYTEQQQILRRYTQQLGQWQMETLTAARHLELARLTGLVRRMIRVTDQILDLIAAITPHTIDALMRKNDEELGVEALLHQGKR